VYNLVTFQMAMTETQRIIKKNWEEIIEVSESIVPLRFATLFVTRKIWCFFSGMAGDEIEHGL
jgi:hypothetical protein